jgi:hypothetical protein
MRKQPTYVVPMDAMVQGIRLAAVEESQLLYNVYPDPVFKPGEIVTAGLFQDRWIRASMKHVLIRELVMDLERALMAKLLQDIFLISTLNAPRINLDTFINRLRHEHCVNEELLFSHAFAQYMRSHDLPDDVKLGYDGLSIYLQAA